LFVLWFSFFTWQLQEFLRRAFYTRGEVHKGMWVSTCANGIRLIIIVILASSGPITGITGLNAIGWGSLGGTLLGIWLGKGYFTLKFQNLVMIWRDNWRFGRWILGASVADWVVVDLYPIMMAGMINFAATGVYQALNNLVAPIHVLLRAVDTFATPVLAKTFDQDGLAKVNQHLRLIYVICAIPVGILLVLVLIFAPQLLTLLRGETYLPYTDAIYMMAVFYFFLFINRPLQMVFRAIRQGKQIFWANVGAAISMFAGGYWLINRWGIYGGIGGQALNAFIISAVLLIAWFRVLRVEKPDAMISIDD
jgi:O-antigen/teichoic acid export membrane protein